MMENEMTPFRVIEKSPWLLTPSRPRDIDLEAVTYLKIKPDEIEVGLLPVASMSVTGDLRKHVIPIYRGSNIVESMRNLGSKITSHEGLDGSEILVNEALRKRRGFITRLARPTRRDFAFIGGDVSPKIKAGRSMPISRRLAVARRFLGL